MKKQEIKFRFGIYSTDEKGEKLEIPFIEITRWELVRHLEYCGVLVPYNSPYSIKGKKTYPIENISNVESNLLCRFGEFRYNAHVWFERV